MSSKPHTDVVYVPKRKPKNPINFQISLNEEQKAAKAKILDNTITVLTGGAGSGKTLLACQIALDQLFNRSIEKIVIARPVITSGEELGFLPGTKEEKLAPYTAPIYDNMHRLYTKDKIEKELAEGNIEIVPIAFMRGRNFTNSLVIVDEGQNITSQQMELLLSRMCMGSKMIICGDNAQIDLKDKRQSGFDFACKHLSTIPNFSVVVLRTNHRDPIVEEILKVYNEFR
jgi:phosphate starvation-inducible PhoH-like protein